MTDIDFRKILEEEWEKRRPRIPMGERRIELATACMRRVYCASLIAGITPANIPEKSERW